MASFELVLPFCTIAELARVSVLDREHARMSELEWRQRVLARFGALRFRTTAWRKCYKLRAHLARRVVDSVSARVYLMNGRGETHFFPIASTKSLMCSRERAVVYNRCERMFELSLRINRSIQEISALIGLVSIDDARGLLNEHINLMASVANLRGSLLFESELFDVFPAPVLLDTNALLRGSFAFPPPPAVTSAAFIDSSTIMMQVWASIDGLVYRPLAPPTVLEPPIGTNDLELGTTTAEINAGIQEIGINPPSRTHNYSTIKLHDLSGMTIHVDDNTLRYRLQADAMCVNALVSNAFLLYVFNPLPFRPSEWVFGAVVVVDTVAYALPSTREGVFLHPSSCALRVFLSYGQIPQSESESESDSVSARNNSTSRARGGDTSAPLAIPCGGGDHSVSFTLTATNRLSKHQHVVVANTSTLSVCSGSVRGSEEDEDGNVTERHVPIANDDAMICYSFAVAPVRCLQYIEFAIGFEPLMHRLGVTDFLIESPAPPQRPQVPSQSPPRVVPT